MVTVLDSFEDGNISEYSGGTGNFTVEGESAYDGAYSLTPDSNGSPYYIYREDLSISPGETPFGYWIDPAATQDAKGDPQAWFAGLLFGRPSGGGLLGYSASITTTDEFRLKRFDSDGKTTLASSTSASYTRGNLYNIELTKWSSRGDITVVVEDSSGTQLDSISTTDSTHSGTTIGWVHFDAEGGYGNTFMNLDYGYKPDSGGSPPSAPSDLNATVV